MRKYEKIKNILLDEYENDELRHAYIFESSDINVATNICKDISKYILQTDNLDMVTDYLFINKEIMNINTIRNIVSESTIKPFKSKKIYVFENCMNFTVAMQNAFLKTLENPPEDVIFMLITQNATYLLDTVRSRCIKYFLDEDVCEISEREDILLITRKIFDILISKDKAKMIEFMKDIKKLKDDVDDIITSLLENSRNIMLAKENINLMPDKNKQNMYIHDIINSFTYYELLSIIDYVEQARRKINSNCSVTITLETMLFNLMEV